MTSFIFLLSKITGMIAFVFLAVMMVFTVTDVVCRGLFNSPIPGSLDLIEFMMSIVGFLGLAWCAVKDRHIKVELLISSFRDRTKSIINTFNYLICLIIFSIIAVQSMKEGIAIMKLRVVSDSLGIPIFPFYWVCAVGYAVLCLVILVKIIEVFKKGGSE